MKLQTRILFLVFFFLLALVFFYKGLSGYAIQGVDGQLSVVKYFAAELKHTVKWWSDFTWIGHAQGGAGIDLYNLFLILVQAGWVQTFAYLFTVFFALVFMFAFLRKIGLSYYAAVFGAIAYGFMPSIISLIYSGHVGVIMILPYPPIIFYGLTAAFAEKEDASFGNFAALLFSGAVWGMMMSDDIQRGLYYSVFAACFIVFLIKQKYAQRWSTILKDIPPQKKGIEALKIFVLLLILFLSFYNGLSNWMEPLKGRMAMDQGNSEAASADKWNFSTMWSFHPAELVDSVAFGFHGALSGDNDSPYWGTKEYAGNSESLGFFVVFFCIIGIVFYFSRNAYVRFFSIAGGLLLLLSFGRFWPGVPFYWIYYHIPMMDNFRAPSKFVSVAAFAVAIVSAFGFEFLAGSLQENKDRFLDNIKKTLIGTAIFIGVGLLCLSFIAAFNSDTTVSLYQKMGNLSAKAAENILGAMGRMLLFSVITLILLFVLWKWKDKKNIKAMVLCAFIGFSIIDLWSVNWFYLDRSYIQEDEFYKPDAVVNYVTNEAKKDTFRVGVSFYGPQGQAIPATGLKGKYLTYIFPYYNIQPMDITATSSKEIEETFFVKALQGASYKPVQSIDDLINANIRLFQVANVKYLITDGFLYIRVPNAPFPVPVSSILTNNTNLVLKAVVNGYDKPHAVFEVKDVLPRVAFFGNYVMVKDANEAMGYLSNPAFDPHKTVIVESPGTVNPLFNEKQPCIAAKIIAYEPWKVKAEVDALQDGYVLMTTKNDPNWQAFVDGKKAKTYTMDAVMTGVAVTKGKHQIDFIYQANGNEIYVSLITILACFATALVGNLIFRKKPAQLS